MGKKTKNDHEALMWIGLVLLIIALILVYIFTLGKADFISNSTSNEAKKANEHKKKLEERIQILNIRYSKIQKILIRKSVLRESLEKICKSVFLGVRLMLAIIVTAMIFIAHKYYNADYKGIFEYFQMCIVLLCFIAFVLYGSPRNIISIWDHFIKKITLYIYGRYISLDQQILTHDDELKSISSEKEELQKELISVEEEIQKVLTEPVDETAVIIDLDESQQN